jgi:hypothetical protein
MIIRKVHSDSNSEIIDTDKLPDIDALVLEKKEELRKLCYNAGYRCLLLVEQRYNDTVSMAYVISDIEDGVELTDTLKSSILEH